MQAKFKGTQHSILNKILSENHFLNTVGLIVLMPAVSRRQYHRVIFWQSLDTPMLPLLLNFQGCLFAWTLWIYLPNLKFVYSFTRSWDNRGYFFGSPWICQRSLFSQILKCLWLAWTLWIYLPNLNFVALPIPEIIGGTEKISAVPGYANAPFSPKFLSVFGSHGPCEYICQTWTS